jgi:hypothetical protein
MPQAYSASLGELIIDTLVLAQMHLQLQFAPHQVKQSIAAVCC